MTQIGCTGSVRANLDTLVDYAANIDQFASRHSPDIREALDEAVRHARDLGMSGARVFIIIAVGSFYPLPALRHVLRFLETAPSQSRANCA